MVEQDSSVAPEVRPWGSYRVLDAGEGFQVKRLEVTPGARISYQTHQHRSEHWFIVQGEGLVTLDGTERRVGPGDAVDVPARAAHRIQNVGEPGGEVLRFIEVQRGDYLGEDDIERLQDDYGRAEADGEATRG